MFCAVSGTSSSIANESFSQLRCFMILMTHCSNQYPLPTSTNQDVGMMLLMGEILYQLRLVVNPQYLCVFFCDIPDGAGFLNHQQCVAFVSFVYLFLPSF